MQKLILLISGLVISCNLLAATDVICPQTITCKGHTCTTLPTTFTMDDFYPHVRKHPLDPIPGTYHFTGAQTPAICEYTLGNLPMRHPYVKLRSPILVPDTAAANTKWAGSFCSTYDPTQCAFKYPSK